MTFAGVDSVDALLLIGGDQGTGLQKLLVVGGLLRDVLGSGGVFGPREVVLVQFFQGIPVGVGDSV